jgi:N-acetyl-anhydromuramyl-L-alanine amidase AmpD
MKIMYRGELVDLSDKESINAARSSDTRAQALSGTVALKLELQEILEKIDASQVQSERLTALTDKLKTVVLPKISKDKPLGEDALKSLSSSDTTEINTALVRNITTNPLGDKYSLVTLGNSLIKDGPNKLTTQELAQLPDIESKSEDARSEEEKKIAAKAQEGAKAYNNLIKEIEGINKEAASILKQAPGFFRDGEYSPAPGVWNFIGYPQCKWEPWLDNQVSKKFFSIHYSVSPTLKDALESLQARSTSVHFIIDIDGKIFQLVDGALRSYSEGLGNLDKGSLNPDVAIEPLQNNLNSFVTSIMLVNNAKSAYPKEQLRNAALLMDGLSTLYGKQSLVGYSDWKGKITSIKEEKVILANGPGKYFPYEKFAQATTDSLFEGLELKNSFGIFPDITELKNALIAKKIAKAAPDGEKLVFINTNPLTDYSKLIPVLKGLGYYVPELGTKQKQQEVAQDVALAAKMHFISDIIDPGRFTREDVDYTKLTVSDGDYLAVCLDLLGGEAAQEDAVGGRTSSCTVM